MASTMNKDRLKRAFILTGPAYVLCLMVPLAGLWRFIPAPNPQWSSDRIAQNFIDHQVTILAGAFIWSAFAIFMITWGAVLAAQCRDAEKETSVLTLAQVMFAGASYLATQFCGLALALAAYRPDELAPETTRLLHDAFWFFMLYTWPPFAGWMIVIAITVFSDRRRTPIYPRWVGYLNLWCALLMIPGGLMSFFKSGPFAYNGLMAYYVLAAAIIVWMFAMTFVMFQRQKFDESVKGRDLDQVPAVLGS